ncbi:MAG: FkbM family methyltransferase [Endomicrobium sp.]|nr:FkbM family methyltransferase [Endomicrobium sp.]
MNTIKLLKIDCEGSEYEILENTKEENLKKILHFHGEFHENENRFIGNATSLKNTWNAILMILKYLLQNFKKLFATCCTRTDVSRKYLCKNSQGFLQNTKVNLYRTHYMYRKHI